MTPNKYFLGRIHTCDNAIGASKNFGCRKLDVFLNLQKNPRNLKNTPHIKNIETFQSIESNKREETIAKWDISNAQEATVLPGKPSAVQ